MKIKGGMSFPGQITIFTDLFSAAAQCDHRGHNINCSVTHLSRTLRFLDDTKLPIPILVRLAVCFVVGITAGKLLRFGIFLLVCWLFHKHMPSLPDLVFGLTISPLAKSIITYAFLALCIRTFFATWHAAEHMAIATYEQTGSADFVDMKRQSRIHDRCGTAFLFPLIVVLVVADIVAEHYGINSYITTFVLLECVLWIDKLIGFDKIPGIIHLSRHVQRYITTRPPGELELRTAQRALQELVAAHRNLE